MGRRKEKQGQNQKVKKEQDSNLIKLVSDVQLLSSDNPVSEGIFTFRRR